MKKIFTLIAVAMMAINAMAQKTVTVALDDNALTNLGAGSYITEVKDVEATWTFDGTDFLVSNICRNAKNQPAGYSGDQFIQVKGSTTASSRGYIINKEAMDLASLVITTPTATEKVIVSAGTSADELTEVTPTISTVDLEVKTYNSTTKAEGTGTKTLNVLTYDLTGMKFVKITASSALHIWSAVIGLAEETTDEPSADEDTFNITVTDGKLTITPTNAERAYLFGMVSEENWAEMQAEGYTAQILFEEAVEDESYNELVEEHLLYFGVIPNMPSIAIGVMTPGVYYFLAAYVDKDLTVSNPVEIKLTVDEQGNFVLDTPTSIKNANVVKQIRKFIENGKIVMMKDGKKFNAAGMLVK